MCPVCGQPVPTARRGRPRVYDTPDCARLAIRLRECLAIALVITAAAPSSRRGSARWHLARTLGEPAADYPGEAATQEEMRQRQAPLFGPAVDYAARPPGWPLPTRPDGATRYDDEEEAAHSRVMDARARGGDGDPDDLDLLFTWHRANPRLAGR